MKKTIMIIGMSCMALMGISQTKKAATSKDVDSVYIVKSVDDMSDKVYHFPTFKIPLIDKVQNQGVGISAFIDEKEYDNNMIRIKAGTTSSGYIVNSHYYDTLINLFTYCNENMSRDKWSGGQEWEPYALDQQWRVLQKNDNWFGFEKDLIKQRNISSTIMEERYL